MKMRVDEIKKKIDEEKDNKIDKEEKICKT